MADEYVTKEQFGEFTTRMDQAFAHVHQRLDEQNQSLNQRFSEIHADTRQTRNWLLQLYIVVVFGLVVFGFISGITLVLFRELLFR